VWQLAKEIEKAGATLTTLALAGTKARIPTIATSVPRAPFPKSLRRLKSEVQHSADYHATASTSEGLKNSWLNPTTPTMVFPWRAFPADAELGTKPPKIALRNQHLHRPANQGLS